MFIMKRMLIIGKDQFGYLIDTYKYCEHLKSDYQITYFCIDRNKPKIELPGIDIRYSKVNKGLFKQFLFLIKEVKNHLKEEDYDIVFTVYFRFSFLLTFFVPIKKLIVDIRTGNVAKHRLKRFLSDLELKFNTMFFRRITIISEGLADKLGIKKYDVLPLGANKMVEKREDIEGLKLLYVGTLHGRNLEDAIIGYKAFLEKYEYSIKSKFTIIGSGTKSDEEKLNNLVTKEGLEERVFLLGRKDHSELGKYLFEHNVGVSYIPITDYFNYQPPTKTFEYLMNGLICLATETAENKKVITAQNGFLCRDNPLSFSRGLEKIYLTIEDFDTNKIMTSVNKYTWDMIINQKLKSILNRN